MVNKNVKNIAKGAKSALKLARKAQKEAKKLKKVAQFADKPLETTGGWLGNKMGERTFGRNAGKFLGRIVGSGDYTVRSNTLMTSSWAGDTVPQFGAGGPRGIRVTHREYIGDIITSSDGSFKIQQFALNPGLNTTFPWLAGIAAQYDQWKPNGIVAAFKTTASTYSGTAALGVVVMATDYDVDDPPYASKVEMENSEFAVSASVANSLLHPVECAMNERPTRVLYTRQGDVREKHFYDLGNFYVATAGAAPSTNIGELWITYDITFYKEQIPRSLPGTSTVWQATGSFANDTGRFLSLDIKTPVSGYSYSLTEGQIKLPTNGFTSLAVSCYFTFMYDDAQSMAPVVPQIWGTNPGWLPFVGYNLNGTTFPTSGFSSPYETKILTAHTAYSSVFAAVTGPMTDPSNQAVLSFSLDSIPDTWEFQSFYICITATY